jgi:dethiobiotin synthetase
VGILFVGGIDTGIGKTVVTGLIGRYLVRRGGRAVTQKLVETGGEGVSKDIRSHRRLMGMELLPEDREGLTCPYLFPFPASPHLAAAREGVTIDPAVIERATDTLLDRFEDVVIEGVGGLAVPLTEEVTTLDYLAGKSYPLVIVSSPRLGSINHTLLTLRAARERGLDLLGIAYNLESSADPAIVDDSRRLFRRSLEKEGFPNLVIDIPLRDSASPADPIDFSPLFSPLEEGGRR